MIFEEILKIAKDENLSVFGMGPAIEMEDEPPGYRPEDFLPGTKGIICFGIPIPKDIYQTPTHNLELAWRTQNLLYRKLDTLSFLISSLLEKNGFRSLPVYGCMPLGINKKGVVVGYINQIRMAEILKIGTIGKNGLLLHSKYGSRLMLGGLLTTAPLPIKYYPKNEEPGCPPDCTICSDACPVNAIMPEKKKVRIMRCLGYTSKTTLMSKLKFALLKSYNTDKAIRYLNTNTIDELTFHICSKCVAMCPYNN